MGYDLYPYRLEMGNISGGLNNTELPQRLTINESPDLLNCRPLAADKWGQRNGIEIVGNRLTSNGVIWSLWNFKKLAGAKETLIRSRDAILEYINTLTNIQGIISITVNPANTNTWVVAFNGTNITFTFVSAIGVTAGNVLIGATAADTLNNLLDLLQHPSVTNANHVALSAPNQTLVGYLTWTLLGSNIVGNANNVLLTTLVPVSFATGGDTFVVNLPAASWTQVPGATGYSPNLKFGFANDLTRVYYGNGYDPLAYWDGTSGNIVTFGSTYRGNILAFYLQRLIIAGDPANPANIYYSKTGIPTDFTFGSPRNPADGGVLTVGDGGDEITSLKTLIASNGTSSLLVFKKSTRIYAITFATDGTPDIKEPKSDTGSVTDRMTFAFENDIMYTDENNNIQTFGTKSGIYNTLQKTQASNNLDSQTKDMDFSGGCGFYFKRQKFAVVCGKSFGATVNDTLFAYYLKYRSWWLWTGINANQFAEYNKHLCYASSVDQNVYRIGDRYDDLPDPTGTGNPISCYRSTKDIDGTEFMLSKNNAGQRRLRIPGVSMRYKQARFIWVEGFISSNGKIDVSLISNSDPTQIVTKSILGNGKQVDASILVSLGEKVFGLDAFGGFASSSDTFPVKHFLARVSFDLYSCLRFRVKIGQQKVGAPFVIINVLPWFMIQPDEFFDDNADL